MRDFEEELEEEWKFWLTVCQSRFMREIFDSRICPFHA